jgi:hypothetical protein
VSGAPLAQRRPRRYAFAHAVSTTSIADRIQKELPEVVSDPELKARLTQWLTADKEFNLWFLVTTKRQLHDDDLMALLDGYRESQEIVEEAWAAFCDQKKDGAALIESLDDSLKRMERLQGRG